MFDTIDALFFMERHKREIAAGMIALIVGYQLINNFYSTNDKEVKEATKNVK